MNNPVEIMLILTVKGVITTERAEEIYSTIKPMFNVVEEFRKEYSNGGLSYIGLIEESTIAMHYYPEYGLMTIIVSTCGDEGETLSKFRQIIVDLMHLYSISYRILAVDVSGRMRLMAKHPILI